MEQNEKKLSPLEGLETLEQMPAQELPADIPAEVRKQLEQDLNEKATEDLKQNVREAEEEEAREAARETESAPRPDQLTKSRLLKLLVKKQYVKLREVTEDTQPADLAELLEELDENNRLVVFRLLKKEVAAEAFTYMSEDAQADLVEAFSDVELIAAIEEMSLVRTDGLSGRYVGELSDMVTDFTGPTVTIAPEASNYEVGDTVSFTVVAEDETTASEDIALDVEVTYGSGDTFEVIEAENNSFLAEKAGDYTVTVTATDEFGNETVESITITVSEAPSPVDPDDSGSASTPSTSEPGAIASEPGPSDPVNEPAGLEPGAIAGIVIGAIAGVAVIGFLVWFFLLRKKK